jgi:hypothetical protein
VLLAEDEASERPTVIAGNLELRSLAMVSERTTTRGARDGVRNNSGIADGSVLQRLLEDQSYGSSEAAQVRQVPHFTERSSPLYGLRVTSHSV